MAKAIDMSGMVFGELTVLERANDRVSPGGNKRIYWKCKCNCGNTTEVDGSELRKGHTRSCGCQWHKTGKGSAYYKHGDAGTKLYKVWQNMKRRCCVFFIEYSHRQQINSSTGQEFMTT